MVTSNRTLDFPKYMQVHTLKKDTSLIGTLSILIRQVPLCITVSWQLKAAVCSSPCTHIVWCLHHGRGAECRVETAMNYWHKLLPRTRKRTNAMQCSSSTAHTFNIFQGDDKHRPLFILEHTTLFFPHHPHTSKAYIIVST